MDEKEQIIDPVDLCKNIFGEFEPFQEKFISMKFGSIPTSVHPSPRSIALVRRWSSWPSSFNMLTNLKVVCYSCKNKNIFSPCKLCLKAMVGECFGFLDEARIEYGRLKCEMRKNGGKQK